MNSIEFQCAGPFLILPKGMDYFPECLHPRIDTTMSLLETKTASSCDYCSRIYSHGATQCESCGAPRRKEGCGMNLGLALGIVGFLMCCTSFVIRPNWFSASGMVFTGVLLIFNFYIYMMPR